MSTQKIQWIALRATFFFLPYFDVICGIWLKTRKTTGNLFVNKWKATVT